MVGPVIPLRAFVQFGLPLLVLGCVQLGFHLTLRRWTCLDLSVLLFGISRMGSCFSLPILDLSSSDASLILRSLACPEASTFVLTASQLDAPSVLQAFTCPGLQFLLSGMAGSGISGDLLLALDFSNLGFSSLTRFFDKLDFTCSALDFVHFALTMSLHHLAHLDFSLPSVDASHLDLPLLLQSFASYESSLLLFGLARLGFLSMLPVQDCVHLEVLFSIRSFSYFGLALLTSESFRLGLFSLMRCLSGCSMLASGVSRVDLLFALPLIESAMLDLSFSPRRFG